MDGRHGVSSAGPYALVWIGDLNYRLNLTDDIVRGAIAAGNHASLMTGDQLILEQAAGRAFVVERCRLTPIEACVESSWCQRLKPTYDKQLQNCQRLKFT
jgi:hypothetical protein